MRTFKNLMALVPVVLTVILSAPLRAQNTVNAITPFSWPQFKADYGLPSTPTTLYDSAQTDGTFTSPTVAYPLTKQEQIRAYLLGNYGTVLPPTGLNNMLDLEEGNGVAGVDTLEAWIGPFNGDTAGANQSIIVDDDNNLNSTSLYESTNSNTIATTVYGVFGYNNWTQIMGSSIPFGTQNYNGDSYYTIPAVNRAVEDANDNPAGLSPNYAHWKPYITTPGYYTIYAWFPSQNLTAATPEPHVTDARYTVYVKLPGQAPVSSQVTVDQTNGGTWVPIGGPHYLPETSQNFNYTQNGTGAVTFNGSGPDETTNYQNSDQFVSIRVDDTTANSVTQYINGKNVQNFVVADAIELRANDGISTRSLGTPVAVNITPPILANYPEFAPASTQPSIPGETGTVGDYVEIALGYSAGNPAGDGHSGGLPISYVTDAISTVAGVKQASASPPQFFNGSVGYNSTATSNDAAGLTSSLTTLPIDQVVYFTRTESEVTDPNNPLVTTPVGFLYCVNGATGDVIWRFPNSGPSIIGDTDTTGTPAPFSSTSFTPGDTINSSSSYGGEAYSVSNTAGAKATWIAPAVVSGEYHVYVWYPSEGNGETYGTAQYTVNDGAASHICANIDQSKGGGQWVELTQMSGATTFYFTSNGTAAVVLAPVSGNVAADAVEFVPAQSMGTSDSTPAVVRNMVVIDPATGNDIVRTVVIAADNNGKVYCVDAAGNGNGNDILVDSTGAQVYINSTGQAFEDSGFTTPAVLPLSPTAIGTTQVYWIWQPNTAEPFGVSDVLDVYQPAPNSIAPLDWTLIANPNAYDTTNKFDYDQTAVARTGSPPTDYFTYQPLITSTQQGGARVLVWVTGGVTGVSDAEYTVVDNTGQKYICNPVIQNGATGPGWVALVSTTGQTVFNFDTTPNTATPAGWATEKNTIVLDNTTNNSLTGSPVVVADAIKLLFTAGNDANSNLIGPLAFGTCSPTVHVTQEENSGVPVTYTKIYNGYTETYDCYLPKIYIGNSNGVLYALDGTGYPDGSSVWQRDFSQDPLMPSPSVDWWFNVGVTAVDSFGEITEAPGPGPDYDPLYNISESIAGTPAYYHPPANTTTADYDQILFTTYSPQGNNQGRLYSVNAEGPVGDYGYAETPEQAVQAAKLASLPNPLTYYSNAAGVANYNLSPIPYYSFPDAYGELHQPNNSSPIVLPLVDHRPTSEVNSSYGNGLTPAAHALGDAAGSPAIFGVGPSPLANPNGLITVLNPNGGQSFALQPEVYFAANDPTTDGSAATYGRVWGVNLTTGTVDSPISTSVDYTGVNAYIYPNINPDALGIAPGAFDPNIIPLTDPDIIPLTDPDIHLTSTDYITSIFNTQDTTNNYNTLQFGPFTSGPVDFTGAPFGYYVSSSPAVGMIHTIPQGNNNTLTDTLIGGPGYNKQYGSSTGAYNIDIPMLYIGDQNGVLHSLNIAGYDDPSRYIQDATLDGSAIISTPALLANGNGTDISTPANGNDAGGVLFVTTTSGSLWESEAFPFIEGNQTLVTGETPLARNVDFQYGGPGGFSSVAASSYNIDNFQFETAATAGNPSGTITSTAQSVDTSEWIYVSSDNGFTYGLTVDNSSLGNGGSGGTFNPGIYIPPNSVAPPANNTVPLNRNFFTSVFSAAPFANGASSTIFSPTNGRPPQNPVFDWGQTVYIAFYGLDDPINGPTSGTTPSQANAPTANYPKAISVTFNIGPPGSAAYGPGTQTKTINLQSTGAVVPITQQPGVWPPPGFVLNTPSSSSSSPAVGPYAAIYEFQLGNASSGDPQTPGSKIQILGIKEQVQYYTGAASGSPTLVTSIVSARSTAGTIIRTLNTSTNPPTAQDVQEPGIDQATFSILNPIAIRTAGRSMGANPAPNWYDLALSSSSAAKFGELGPFSGVPTGPTGTFALEQGALANGNSVPQNPPVGGTITSVSGTIINSNDPANSTANKVLSDPSIPIILAVAPGMISHGTDGNSATIDPTGEDPTSSIYSDKAATSPQWPGNSGPGDFGESLFDIADRSGLGDILESINNLAASQAALTWNDNSGAGGAGSVVNPLRWETMPTANQPSGSGSVDYNNIAKGNTTLELLPRAPISSNYNSSISNGNGTDSVITNSSGTLPLASTTTPSDPALRTVYPAAAMFRVQVNKFQPANLDSYDPLENSGVNTQDYPRSTRTSDANWSNVSNGYIGSFKVYVNTTGAKASQRAYRTVQLWVSVPVDMRTAITEQTVDIGSVPAGFGVNLSSSAGSPIDNTAWSPFNSNVFQSFGALSQFYKPITIVNNGNVNLINLHLNQYINYGDTSTPTLVPNAFGSYETSSLSTIPSFDVTPSSVGLQTGTPLEPLVRSSLDYFPANANLNANFNVYHVNGYIAGSQTPPPGPTLHKARSGDVTGTIATVPDVPYRNLPNDGGSYNLSGQPYGGRPVVSLAIPLGAPVGTYSQTVSAFEGFDPNSSVYQGPLYNGHIYTTGGWTSGSTVWSLGVTNGGSAAVQTQSNPGTVLTAKVIEGRVTDGGPLPVQYSNGVGVSVANAVLPQVDTGITTANSNDLQPWAYYDSSAPGFGLLWSSARNSSAGSSPTPYNLFGSLLQAPNNLLNTPTAAGRSWWSPATALGSTSSGQSYAASTYPSLSGSGTNALWVTSQISNGQTVYALNTGPVTYSGGSPSFPPTPTVLFYSNEPIFSPRAQWYYSTATPATLQGFTPSTVNGNANSTAYPLVVFYMRVGGRSTLMYWPSTVTANGTSTVGAAAIPVPAGLSSASTPTVVPRPAVLVGGTVMSQVDIVFSGTFGTGGNSDVLTGRYSVAVNAANGAADLTENGTLPTTSFAAMTTRSASPPTLGPAYPTVHEILTKQGSSQVWQAQDVAWTRNVNAFQLNMQITTANGPVTVPLIPAPNGLTTAPPPTPVYDRASGQWVFTINWQSLLTEYSSYSAIEAGIGTVRSWWYSNAATTPNVVAYVNPNSGTVTFSTPPPFGASQGSAGDQFVSLGVDINPQVLRTTFLSKSNSSPISFIDDQLKLNDAPGFSPIFPSRYWYIYRKQSSQNLNAGAATSALYYDTKRLTIVLPNPVQLTYTPATQTAAGFYSLPSNTFSVTDSYGNNITSFVDVDWSRGRVYFPQQYEAASTLYTSEGQEFTVNYTYTSVNSQGVSTTLSNTYPGLATWQDEPLVNSVTQASVSGEHILPINTPANEAEPSAFLDPLAGSTTGGGLALNPSTVTPASVALGNYGQPYAHKVWVFWTSTRNAGNGAGSDIYWETIDPRFEVSNP